MRTLVNILIIKLQIGIHRVGGQDLRRYNAPAVSEVAAIMVGDGTETTAFRDIRVQLKSPLLDSAGNQRLGLKRLSDENAAFNPLHFVLLFPYGELGWGKGIVPLVDKPQPSDDAPTVRAPRGLPQAPPSAPSVPVNEQRAALQQIDLGANEPVRGRGRAEHISLKDHTNYHLYYNKATSSMHHHRSGRLWQVHLR